jgi:two-component sensor histidine kinase
MVHVLVAEANHRIANNLAVVAGLVREQTSALTEYELFSASQVRAMLEGIQARIEAIGQLHRALSARTDTVLDAGEYVREVVGTVLSSLVREGQVRLRTDLESGCGIAADRALCLGLIVNELVVNALKYAHPSGVAGIIDLRVRRGADGDLVVEVEDDGVGLPEGDEEGPGGGAGSALVQTLVRRLDGQITYRSSCLGLHASVRMPLHG